MHQQGHANLPCSHGVCANWVEYAAAFEHLLIAASDKRTAMILCMSSIYHNTTPFAHRCSLQTKAHSFVAPRIPMDEVDMGTVWITYIVRTGRLHNNIDILKITEHDSKLGVKSEAHGCIECFTAKSKFTFFCSILSFTRTSAIGVYVCTWHGFDAKGTYDRAAH